MIPTAPIAGRKIPSISHFVAITNWSGWTAWSSELFMICRLQIYNVSTVEVRSKMGATAWQNINVWQRDTEEFKIYIELSHRIYLALQMWDCKHLTDNIIEKFSKLLQVSSWKNILEIILLRSSQNFCKYHRGKIFSKRHCWEVLQVVANAQLTKRSEVLRGAATTLLCLVIRHLVKCFCKGAFNFVWIVLYFLMGWTVFFCRVFIFFTRSGFFPSTVQTPLTTSFRFRGCVF